MAEANRESSGIPSTLSGVVLDSKVRVPARRRGMVSRRSLIDRARASGARVVGVTAPAGYGKSTLLAEWAALEDRPIACVTLDRFDNDPAALLAVLAHACSRISPEVASVAAQMGGVGAGSLGRSAPLLSAALAAATTPFVLLIDDLHQADSVDCEDALEVVLAGVAQGSQVVIGSRHEQPHLSRLRAGGDAFEIGAVDLRVDASGARIIFERSGADVSEEELERLLERCEGWPTGVFLCALIARSGGDAAAVTGDDRFLSDYLYRECMRSLPADTQRFLRQTAIIEEFSAPACDALIDGRDSAARLRELEAMGLFLVPLDRRRGWFRYHALFRDFLLTELRREEPELEVGLHLRAAEWLETAGIAEHAVDHLLAAGDRPRAAQLAAELALPAYQTGRVATVRRWIVEIGREAVEECVPLLIVAAWVSILLGETIEGDRLATALERVSYDELPKPDRVALNSARAMIRAAMCVDGSSRALADARFAVESEPGWSPWRDQALHLLGATSLLAGDAGVAQQAFSDAIVSATALGNADSVLLSEAELAHMAIDQGDWTLAQRHSQAAIDAIDVSRMEGYSTTALACAVRARVALHFGEAFAAERLLTRAMRARVQCTYLLPNLAVRVRLQLAMAYATMNNRTAAMHLLREADQVIEKRPDLGRLVDEVESFRRRLQTTAGVPGAPPLTPAELRLLPYLQTHLTVPEIGGRLFVSRNTISSEIGSIYRKLAVTSRSAAVARAIEIGLLGE